MDDGRKKIDGKVENAAPNTLWTTTITRGVANEWRTQAEGSAFQRARKYGKFLTNKLLLQRNCPILFPLTEANAKNISKTNGTTSSIFRSVALSLNFFLFSTRNHIRLSRAVSSIFSFIWYSIPSSLQFCPVYCSALHV